MIRLFKHYIPHAVLLLAFLDFVLLLGAAEAGWIFRAHQIGMAVEPLPTRYIPLVSFALSLQVAMIAVGVYGTEALQSLRFATARLLVAISLGVIFLSFIAFVRPGATLWRSNSLYAMTFAFLLLIFLRFLLGHFIGGEAFNRRLIADRMSVASGKRWSGRVGLGGRRII